MVLVYISFKAFQHECYFRVQDYPGIEMKNKINKKRQRKNNKKQGTENKKKRANSVM
jgi:hypothetical protein